MKSPKIRNKCIVCGSELSEPLFVLDNMPEGAQTLLSESDLENDTGVSLPLCRCPKCLLAQFDCEPVSYYRDAIRVVGLSETMKALRRADYRHLIDDYGLAGKKWLECGFSNGDFLSVLAEFPAELYGTENSADNIAGARVSVREALIKNAAVHGLKNEEDMDAYVENRLMKMFPDKADADIPGAPFDCFLSFNFLEHQPDPVTMLKCLRHNLRDNGVGLITVPSFEYILDNGRYYELIRDHIANYDKVSLGNLLKLCGFEIAEKGLIGIGDTIEVIVRKDRGYDENALMRKSGADNAAGPDTELIDKYRALSYNYLMMKEDIEGYMSDLKRKGRSIALWGAGHQGFTIASTTALKDNVKYIIDSSPVKQGHFAPASHLSIVSPETYFEDPVDVIMIAAPGYIREIEKSIRNLYGVRGKGPGVPAICDVTDMRER